MNHKLRTRTAGFIGLLLIASAVGVTLGIYQKAFVDSVDVEVRGDRAGLLLEKGAKVRVYGLQVGEVRSVRADGDGAVLTVALDADEVDRIPADVQADITPTTVFGSKYVDLLVADGGQRGPRIRAGATIQVADVTVEANDVFGQIQDLLTSIEPGKLNRALTGIATGLEGRGDQLGRYLSQVNAYVSAFNGVRPQLVSDLTRADDVLGTYSAVTPRLLDIADQGSVTAATLNEKSASLQALLVDFTNAANRTGSFLGRIDDPLLAALDVLNPVLSSLEKFSPEFTCVLSALVKHRDAVNSVLGLGANPGIQGLVTLLPASPGYEYSSDLPKLIPNAEPSCLSLPAMNLVKPPVRHFDDGSPGPDAGKGFDLTKPPAELYLDLVAQYFGQTGLALLLQDLGLSPAAAQAKAADVAEEVGR